MLVTQCPNPSNLFFFDLRDNVWWEVKTVKFLTVNFSQFSSYFLPLMLKYLSQLHVHENTHPMLVTQCPNPSNLFFFDLRDNVWWEVKTVKFLTVKFSPFSSYFLPLMLKYLPQLHVHENTHPMFVTQCHRPQVSLPYTTAINL